MRIMLFLVLAFVVSNDTYSQDNLKRNYYFDIVTISNVKNYSSGFKERSILFLNQKDSTYSLNIRPNSSPKVATLRDTKKKQIIKFDMDFEYKTVEDLNKLSNSKLYTVVIFDKHKKYKNFVEDFEFERDSINNKTIVHLVRYKNKKRKKIIYEVYYVFGINDNYDVSNRLAPKNYLLENYNLELQENQHLEKIVNIKDDNISFEKEDIITKQIDFNFEFEIDEVYPKKLNNVTIRIEQ